MAQREFVDADGVRWQVWAVVPSSADRRESPDRRADARDQRERRTRRELRVRMDPGLAKGWLVFESAREKRRLHPIPEKWDVLSEAELNALLRTAAPAPHTTRRLIE
jgi:hypothetical protein